MTIIAVISQKGGAGKTALTINLATAATTAKKSAAIIDLDPQASACAWYDLREAPTPAIHVANAATLARTLAATTAEQTDIVMIDTAPRTEATALAAARAADLILIPCRPALVDLSTVPATLDIAKLSGTPATAILNAVPPSGDLPDQARDVLTDMGAAVLPLTIGHRVAFAHAFTRGLGVVEHQPRSTAAQEIHALYELLTTSHLSAAAA